MLVVVKMPAGSDTCGAELEIRGDGWGGKIEPGKGAGLIGTFS